MGWHGPRFEKHCCSWSITRSNRYKWSLNQRVPLVGIRGAVCLGAQDVAHTRLVSALEASSSTEHCNEFRQSLSHSAD
jgi:hypothetical protein